MHILMALVGAIGTLAFICYRISLLKQGVEDVVDTVERAAGAWRRHKFRSKAERPPLETEDDPRAAAAALAVVIMESAAALSADNEAALKHEFATVMGVEDSADLLAYARWITKDVVDPNTVTSRIADLLNAELGPRQKHDLVEMLGRLSNGDPIQVQALGHLKSKIGLQS